jgi:glycosyltransferase involved in cell wall biosynthesis
MRVPELAGALRTLASDASLRGRMGAAGRTRAMELYDEARVVARTLDLMGL